MGKPTGFLEYKRVTPSNRAIEDRLKDYKEIPVLVSEEELRRQGARCMDCGVPFCHAMGCPVYNLIPEWNDAVYKGQWREAYERLELTNNFPEITGRICPAPCETSCTLSINTSPVTIKQLELAIIEKAFAEGWVVPKPPQKETGKKIAIVGSGPAGMAAAQQLRRMGHAVTLFEKAQKIGGILRYGVPDFKFEKWILDRRIQQMKAEGIQFETNAHVGKDLHASDLKKQYDAILITMGAGAPRDLKVPGRELDGIHFAMEYLTKSNMFSGGEIPANQMISAKGKTVLVIGGGDTGSDCVGTANRQGAKKVYQFEILPKPRDWKEPWNPEWPFWPNILRTSTSHEEGCERDWSITTNSFSGRNGKSEEGNFSRVEWIKPQTGGRPEMKIIHGSAFTLKLDLIFLAMGFLHVEHNDLLKDFDVQFDERGNISTNGNYMSSVKGIFAAGDADIGASLVVRAISHGRQAAEAVNQYLLEK
ncbi:MAG: glutamate synthase [Omnitrophica bacterium RIFCSPLOWO2_12_FULL_44_17]|uniref:Glutamate synthase n=1 Tax=Candidatus Danuiimicrobium aquiferis TaxID=1801832 RepID=A0A1G1L370_9BACT|nr:MAG: glutamate synthase [Omnitrophica bacterium RIFCSPHIGHO2_02_FULL_45_28]OGW89105.1 MAG: glutamate synthase [Omnitrophica bacterium RIFCSPHIGHO2_12_FULL_44_12]OGW99586.1 MAG: glutamate synthase [Omnitrophica bacterium RIFCSPLOWO2_12_FULL_44_17]OGX03620.1 MAG: glutamate synthase [Omnitrophica bacterium RIFCSPLOWO2_02_FULL_44_11]